MITLYVDGDAFPNLLKPILLRSIERLQIKTYVIANKKINIGESRHVEYIIVDTLADEADNKIVEMLEEGDLIITADGELMPANSRVYNINGQLVSEDAGSFQSLPSGIYIINGKKYIK